MPNSISAVQVPNVSYKHTKFVSVDDFFGSGAIVLEPGDMKQTKNVRDTVRVFSVHHGAVKVKMHENEFSARAARSWCVPRGMVIRFPSSYCLRVLAVFASVICFLLHFSSCLTNGSQLCNWLLFWRLLRMSSCFPHLRFFKCRFPLSKHPAYCLPRGFIFVSRRVAPVSRWRLHT
jgi:hypothetical protein